MKALLEKILDFIRLKGNGSVVHFGETLVDIPALRLLGALIGLGGLAADWFSLNMFAVIAGLVGWIG